MPINHKNILKNIIFDELFQTYLNNPKKIIKTLIRYWVKQSTRLFITIGKRKNCKIE